MTAHQKHAPSIFHSGGERKLWSVVSFAGALMFSGNPATADTQANPEAAPVQKTPAAEAKGGSASRSKANSEAAAQVQKTLAAEPKGGKTSRDEQLVKAIETAPDYSPARWAAC